MKSGAAKCGFTSAWISWIQTENLNALHDKPYSTKANGFGGLDAEFTFNNDLTIRHWGNSEEVAGRGALQIRRAWRRR